MPNWTANSLRLTAKNAESEAKLSELVRELARAHATDENPEFFDKIKPVPAPLKIVAGWSGDKVEQAAREEAERQNKIIYGYSNWYDFCIGEWGTKWDMRLDDGVPFDLDGHVLTVWFDTAWSPPIPIYHALEAMGFKVEATYIECGMGFVGHYRDGIDTEERFGQFATPENWDDNEQFETYFTERGFGHFPANWGG